MWKRIALIIILCLPVAAWALIKPVRVVMPGWAGVSCVSETICIDKLSRYEEAVKLYDEALTFVDASVGTIERKPQVIFCTSDACFQSFGLGRRAAATIGPFAIVISPRAWKSYYLRHEMIHHLQQEKLGFFTVWREPAWFTEGMAYALSDDPRPKLAEPFESYRSQFKQWYQQVGKDRLWSAPINSTSSDH